MVNLSSIIIIHTSLDKSQTIHNPPLDIFLSSLFSSLPIKLPPHRPKRYVTTGKSVLHCVFFVLPCAGGAAAPPSLRPLLVARQASLDDDLFLSQCLALESSSSETKPIDSTLLLVAFRIWSSSLAFPPPTDKKSRVFENLKHRATYKRPPALSHRYMRLDISVPASVTSVLGNVASHVGVAPSRRNLMPILPLRTR